MSEALRVVTETFSHLSEGEQAKAIDAIYATWTAGSESRRLAKAGDSVSAAADPARRFYLEKIYAEAARAGVIIPASGKMTVHEVDKILASSPRKLTPDERIGLKTRLFHAGIID